jgi:Putative MetA-pathway of phenol degradation
VIEWSVAVSTVIALLFSAAHAHAGEIEPRAYVNTPVGINFLLAGYAYSDGGLSTEASSPIKDAQLKIHTGLLAYARSVNVWGKSGKIDVILPYSQLSGSAMVAGETRERNVSGLNDPRFRFSVNFYGAPALSLQEFANYQQDLIIGASIQVSAPLGQYDKDKLVNLGNNRWFVKPDIGISKAWGPLAIELSTGVFFFSKNDDYFGGKTLEEDPVSSTQLHVTYNFGHGLWAALSGTYDYGGRSTIDGVRSDDLENNSRVGVTVALPVNRNTSIKLFANTGVHISSGSDYRLVGIVCQYRWGGGL